MYKDNEVHDTMFPLSFCDVLFSEVIFLMLDCKLLYIDVRLRRLIVLMCTDSR